jgi:Animal haem peroxidase
MKGGHGKASRLLPGLAAGLNFAMFDRIVKSGGEGVDAIRLAAINAFLGPKRFGKMFPDAQPFRPPDDGLINLGQAMKELAPSDPPLDVSEIPAGFTYLGQFIDHDITFDQTAGFPEINDPNEMEQARTPNFDLDSVYGLGPHWQPELYEPGLLKSRAKLRIGSTSPLPSSGGNGLPDVPVSLPNDLPRESDKTAIIGDPRNDENLVVAQTHLAFLKFHNRLMDSIPHDPKDDDESSLFNQAEEDKKKTGFHKARRLVRWHYQWLVMHDFLARLVDPGVLNDVLTKGRKFYDFKGRPFHGQPFMPIEFSGAAYRFGHTLVREVYNFNRVFAEPAVEPTAIVPATIGLLFQFTGSGGFIDNHPTLPSNWIIDWRRFHEVGEPKFLNFTRRIDTKLAPQLQQLPGMGLAEPQSLAVRNLLRGSRIGLPAGQDVAAIVGAPVLSPAEVANGDDGDILRAHGFHERTPLWYYILKEAEVQGGGKRLGAVGSRILCEVFVGMLEGDKNSYFSKKKDWKPTLPSQAPNTFTMADLLRIVNEISVIG